MEGLEQGAFHIWKVLSSEVQIQCCE